MAGVRGRSRALMRFGPRHIYADAIIPGAQKARGGGWGGIWFPQAYKPDLHGPGSFSEVELPRVTPEMLPCCTRV